MTERPILLKDFEVRAILEGRKTQMRRVMKSQPHAGVRESVFVKSGIEDGHGREIRNPYGKKGNHLWVRETWRIGAWQEDGDIAVDYAASPEMTSYKWLTIPDDPDGAKFEEWCIKLSDELDSKGIQYDKDGLYHWESGKAPLRWYPSTQMPRWASRITLEITGVRVERLQDISHKDSLAEGVLYDVSKPDGSPLSRFHKSWDSVNGKGSWDTNPYVWVIDFKMVEGGNN